MSKHTPGPWALIEEPISVTVVGHNKEVIFHESDKRLPGVLADARLVASAPDLLEALLFAERRSRQPGESQLGWFERLADEFYRRHGYLAPGKDDPITVIPDEERRAAWGAFLNEPTDARRAAIAKAKGEQQ